MTTHTQARTLPLIGLSEGREFIYALDEPPDYNTVVRLREEFPDWLIYKDVDDPTGCCLVFTPKHPKGKKEGNLG